MLATSTPAFWQPNWPAVRRNFQDWWNQRGLILWLTAPANRPRENLPRPPQPATLEDRWFDGNLRARWSEYHLSRTHFAGDSFPYHDVGTGAGDLAAFLGSPIDLSPDTIWFNAIISDPDTHPILRFDPANEIFRKSMALVEAGVALSRGRFHVSIPDLVENIDILSSLRGGQNLMLDLIERPAWVRGQIERINELWFEVFDRFRAAATDEFGGNVFPAFRLWGPGKTAKVQCDACAMFSPAMFREFVMPSLAQQCRRLDYSMYHLDGTQCIVHLDNLLAIEHLGAIEWTPQAGAPAGGNKTWYPLYRRILQAGKSVQAVGVRIDEVIPLLDAVGPRGVYLMCQDAANEDEARKLEERVAHYR